VADQKAEQAPGGKKDTAEYSASKAPETQAKAKKPSFADWRLIPGGSMGAGADVGMSGIRREVVITGGAKPAQLDMTDSPQGLEV
jgi:hypothetical protein